MKKNDLKTVILNTYVNQEVMDNSKSQSAEASTAELKLLNAMRENPILANQLTEIVQRFDAETDTGMGAYTVELKVVEATRIIGKIMVEQWANKTQKSASAKSASKNNLIKKGKKTLLA